MNWCRRPAIYTAAGQRLESSSTRQARIPLISANARRAALKYGVLGGLAAVLATAVYRAAAEPITTDEARIFDLYIQHSAFTEIFTSRYDSANHVLQTILAFGAIRWFGASEFILRVPSLVASLFYLIAAWRIAQMVFSSALYQILAIGLAVLNPLVFDHFSLARGYGMALAFFAWSLYLSLEGLQGTGRRKSLIGSGVCLGLSVAANLVFAIPGIGLAFMVLSMLRRQASGWRLAVGYALPGLLAAAVFLAWPLSSAEPGDFYFGQADLRACILGLMYGSLRIGGVIRWDWAEVYDTVLRVAGFCIFPAMLAAVGVLWLSAGRNRNAHESASLCFFRLAGGALLISVVTILAAHRLIHLMYPYGRTGLYLIVLFPLSVLAAAEVLRGRSAALRVLTAWSVTLMSLVLLMYCLELHTSGFAEWTFAADVKTYLAAIREREAGRSRIVRIGGNFAFSYILNFYRDTRGWTWFERLKNSDEFRPGYDYYLLVPDDRHYLTELHLTPLQDAGSSILAVP